MPSDHRLSTPLLTVTLDDGRALTVQAANPDYLNWDRTAAKHNWPGMRSAPFMWMTFVAWSALRRTGQIPQDLGWEAFSEVHCLQVSSATEGAPSNGRSLLEEMGLVDPEEDGAVASVGPTLQAPGPG